MAPRAPAAVPDSFRIYQGGQKIQDTHVKQTAWHGCAEHQNRDTQPFRGVAQVVNDIVVHEIMQGNLLKAVIQTEGHVEQRAATNLATAFQKAARADYNIHWSISEVQADRAPTLLIWVPVHGAALDLSAVDCDTMHVQGDNLYISIPYAHYRNRESGAVGIGALCEEAISNVAHALQDHPPTGHPHAPHDGAPRPPSGPVSFTGDGDARRVEALDADKALPPSSYGPRSGDAARHAAPLGPPLEGGGGRRPSSDDRRFPTATSPPRHRRSRSVSEAGDPRPPSGPPPGRRPSSAGRTGYPATELDALRAQRDSGNQNPLLLARIRTLEELLEGYRQGTQSLLQGNIANRRVAEAAAATLAAVSKRRRQRSGASDLPPGRGCPPPSSTENQTPEALLAQARSQRGAGGQKRP